MENQSEPKEFQRRPDMAAIIKLHRARQMAAAIIQRGKEAGIPNKYLRINQQTFSDVLDPSFHGGKVKGVVEFSTSIYQDPDFLLNRDFIAIDGGNTEARILAGFAILFRMIAYDKRGQYVNCESLIHKFQTFNSTEEITRNDLAEDLKGYDILMIGEFFNLRFSPHFETGSFFDEVLAERVIAERSTIVTFVQPIISEKMSQEKLASEGKLDSGCGRYLAMLNLTPQTTKSVLRVRVKNL